jgi:hypothetical protein
MPRLSLWKNGTKTNDYRFFDRAISEKFTIGGTGVLLHKYLGPADTGPSDDATQPQYTTQSEKNIQDILFGENRDRKYDTDIYTMRGIYTRSDQDFDLSQFGIFLTSGTLFMTFHLNDMVEQIGRKIMSGDVVELQHLLDEHSLNDDVPAALKRYYVVSDASWPADGFSATWFPHLWRVKLNPLVDSQEYKDILNKIKTGSGDQPVGDIISTYQKYLDINEAVVTQAENDVPQSGYNTDPLYTPPTIWDSENKISSNISMDTGAEEFDPELYTPTVSKYESYMTGDGLAPNGHPVQSGTSFPDNSLVSVGDYFLRVDFMPQRLFRFEGKRWTKVEDVQRTSISRGSDNKTQRSTFVNNTNTLTDSDGVVREERVSLHDVFKAKPD